MTQEEKRIKIAGALGITKCWHGCEGRIRGYNEADEWVLVPDYFNDLNAMHEAEKMLTIHQQNTMNDTLWDMLKGCKYLWHSTASEHAEAFGLTLGLWES